VEEKGRKKNSKGGVGNETGRPRKKPRKSELKGDSVRERPVSVWEKKGKGGERVGVLKKKVGERSLGRKKKRFLCKREERKERGGPRENSVFEKREKHRQRKDSRNNPNSAGGTGGPQRSVRRLKKKEKRCQSGDKKKKRWTGRVGPGGVG